jgi:branched-subunit amino acid transport protein AzlD
MGNALSLPEAIIATFAMAAVIFFCRALPFIFFGKNALTNNGNGGPDAFGKFMRFVEKIAPPVAMTVLCFNAIAVPMKDDVQAALPVILASCLTALLHIWKRNVMLSIFTGTVFFMLAQRMSV